MHTAIIVLHIIVSAFLVIAVLLQVGKGATIGSTFGGTSSQTLFGGAGPTTFLGKVTIASAVVFMLTSLYLTYLSGGSKRVSIMEAPTVKEAPAETPQTDQAAPTPATEPRPVPAGPQPATQGK